MELEKYIDYTLLKSDATESQISSLCHEAVKWNLKAVCVNPWNIEICKEIIEGSETALCTVIGFPLGASLPEIKIAEAERALALGADELDMVINIGALKDKKDDFVFKEINQITNLVKKRGKILKVIIETSVLTEEEKERVCKIIMKTDADFVKTSTGFSGGGATVEDIYLIKNILGESKKIKASGGIRTREFALELIEAGADRLGASSAKAIIFP